MPRRAVPQQRFTAPRHRAIRARSKSRRNPNYRTPTTYSNTVTNSGTVASADFTISIAGPVTPTSVYFENTTQGKTVWITLAPASGQTLVVDFYARTVTLAGVAQTDALTSDSRWWDLSAGANTIRSNVGATVAARDAFH